jgi:hypothetical protein
MTHYCPDCRAPETINGCDCPIPSTEPPRPPLLAEALSFVGIAAAMTAFLFVMLGF